MFSVVLRRRLIFKLVLADPDPLLRLLQVPPLHAIFFISISAVKLASSSSSSAAGRPAEYYFVVHQ